MSMPSTVAPVLAEGTLRVIEQPALPVDDELALRPWRAGDAPAVREAFSDPDIQRWHAHRIDDLEEAADWTRQWRERWAAERDASWAIVRVDDGSVVGQAGLRTIALWVAEAQVSYWVLPGARGAGIAARATAAVRDWAFGRLRLHRVFLLHSTRNVASCRVAARTGFGLEATLREYMLHSDGWHDMHLHTQLMKA
jgi:RimJ/RimL family protein N-acetyltransferase